MSYEGRDPGDEDAKLGIIKSPPKNLKFYAVLPNLEELLRRQRTIDHLANFDSASEDLEWYSDLAKQLKAFII